MKKLLISLMSMVMVIAMVGGGAFAYFSDTETSTGNSFTAGTLNLTVNAFDGVDNAKQFVLTDLKPTDSGTITYALVNTGSLAGYLDVTAVVNNKPGLTPESEGVAPSADLGELGANIDLTVTMSGSATPVYTGKLNGFVVSDYAMAAGDVETMTISWSIDKGVGNEIQGDIAEVALTFELAQTAAQ
jgi:spore coat-associated protein N